MMSWMRPKSVPPWPRASLWASARFQMISLRKLASPKSSSSTSFSACTFFVSRCR